LLKKPATNHGRGAAAPEPASSAAGRRPQRGLPHQPGGSCSPPACSNSSPGHAAARPTARISTSTTIWARSC